MKVEHINITLPPHIKNALDKEVKKTKTKRSTLIQKAVIVYLNLSRKQQLQRDLSEGYLEMAEETKKIMADFSAADSESLKYVD